MPLDTYRALAAQPPLYREDGSESPIDASSRSSTPGCYSPELDYQSCASSTRPSSSHLSSHPTTSMSELSQYFRHHSIKPQRRSTPNPLDHAHAPLGFYRPHDPADLALLSTTHAHRIARRTQSLRGLQCNPKHLHRVASLVEGMMQDSGDTTRREITSQPSTVSLSEDGSSSSSSDFSSLTSMSSPESEEAPNGISLSTTPSSSSSSSYSYSYFKLEGTSAEVQPTPRPKSVTCCRVGKELRHVGSHEKVLRPIRMRRRPRKESLVGGR